MEFDCFGSWSLPFYLLYNLWLYDDVVANDWKILSDYTDNNETPGFLVEYEI